MPRSRRAPLPLLLQLLLALRAALAVPPHRKLKLPNGHGAIPILGLGTADASSSGPPFTCADAVEAALRMGYRHIDTAVFYENHRDIAQGIERSGVPREEIWITSKLAMHGGMLKLKGEPGADATRAFVQDMLEELQTSYIDLVLVHFPGVQGSGLRVKDGLDEFEGDVERAYSIRREIWMELQMQREMGHVRNIGVSNYLVPHLEELRTYSAQLPAVNQLELHPYLPRRDVLDWCRAHGVVVEAYGSVVQDIYRDLLEEEAVREIATQHSATPAQVALAWAMRRDIVVLPKSSREERIEENAKAVDLELSDAEEARLDALDCSLPGSKCRFPTRCGDFCGRGVYYWDPSRVPVSSRTPQVQPAVPSEPSPSGRSEL